MWPTSRAKFLPDPQQQQQHLNPDTEFFFTEISQPGYNYTNIVVGPTGIRRIGHTGHGREELCTPGTHYFQPSRAQEEIQ